MKSSKNKEVQLIQETERGDIQPKIQTEEKKVRRIVPTMISAQAEPMETAPVVKEPPAEEMKP